MSFGENLQAIRKKNHLTQEGLAGMLGVSRQAVSKWELGEGYPEVDKLMILSKKLNVSLDSLLGGENLPADFGAEKPSGKIRIFSPNEGHGKNLLSRDSFLIFQPFRAMLHRGGLFYPFHRA